MNAWNETRRFPLMRKTEIASKTGGATALWPPRPSPLTDPSLTTSVGTAVEFPVETAPALVNEAAVEAHLLDERRLRRQHRAKDRRLQVTAEISVQLREVLLDAPPQIMERDQV